MVNGWMLLQRRHWSDSIGKPTPRACSASSAPRNASTARRIGVVGTPVSRSGKRPATGWPSVVTPRNGSASAASAAQMYPAIASGFDSSRPLRGARLRGRSVATSTAMACASPSFVCASSLYGGGPAADARGIVAPRKGGAVMLETRKTVDEVQGLLDELVASGREVGLQAAAYLGGELVLDTWAGTADEQTGRAVDGDTLFVVFSATKGVMATSIHMLADRGELDYEAPVARYWPEFGKHGKERVTLRQALSHQAGIPQMPAGTTPELMCDWDAIPAAIADLTPLWEPGSRTQYHGMTFGWIVGEVLRRVDGRDVRTFVHEEIAGPLGGIDLHVGTTPEQLRRVARLRNAPGSTVGADNWNRDDLRQAIVPAAGGQFNARSLARMYAALANWGELDGVRLLSRERIEAARVPQTK